MGTSVRACLLVSAFVGCFPSTVTPPLPHFRTRNRYCVTLVRSVQVSQVFANSHPIKIRSVGFEFNRHAGGSTMFDSGTTYAYLTSHVWWPIAKNMIKRAHDATLVADHSIYGTTFSPCWNASDHSKFPNFTFSFVGGASVTITPQNVRLLIDTHSMRIGETKCRSRRRRKKNSQLSTYTKIIGLNFLVHYFISNIERLDFISTILNLFVSFYYHIIFHYICD